MKSAQRDNLAAYINEPSSENPATSSELILREGGFSENLCGRSRVVMFSHEQRAGFWGLDIYFHINLEFLKINTCYVG